jgi:hypothetical protein
VSLKLDRLFGTLRSPASSPAKPVAAPLAPPPSSGVDALEDPGALARQRASWQLLGGGGNASANAAPQTGSRSVEADAPVNGGTSGTFGLVGVGIRSDGSTFGFVGGGRSSDSWNRGGGFTESQTQLGVRINDDGSVSGFKTSSTDDNNGLRISDNERELLPPPSSTPPQSAAPPEVDAISGGGPGLEPGQGSSSNSSSSNSSSSSSGSSDDGSNLITDDNLIDNVDDDRSADDAGAASSQSRPLSGTVRSAEDPNAGGAGPLPVSPDAPATFTGSNQEFGPTGDPRFTMGNGDPAAGGGGGGGGGFAGDPRRWLRV